MLWKQNTIGITKSDILSLINIVKRVHAINNDNNLNDTDKFREVFATLEDYPIVDDCDIINDNLIDIDDCDNINNTINVTIITYTTHTVSFILSYLSASYVSNSIYFTILTTAIDIITDTYTDSNV